MTVPMMSLITKSHSICRQPRCNWQIQLGQCEWIGGRGFRKPPPLLLWAPSRAESSDSLVEEQVSVGRQRLLQAGFAHRVVRHPQPLGAEGWGTARWGRAAPVCDKMSWVHVAMMDQHGHQLEKVLCGTGRKNTNINPVALNCLIFSCLCWMCTVINKLMFQRQFTCNHKWGWAVGSHQESGGTQTSRSRWTEVCCCYDAPRLRTKCNMLLWDGTIWKFKIIIVNLLPKLTVFTIIFQYC